MKSTYLTGDADGNTPFLVGYIQNRRNSRKTVLKQPNEAKYRQMPSNLLKEDLTL